ncbi:hypothetical protein F5880DRAFT_1639917, partial [Lentinula raphanica]
DSRVTSTNKLTSTCQHLPLVSISTPAQFPDPDGALGPSVPKLGPPSAVVPPSGAIPTRDSPLALSVGNPGLLFETHSEMSSGATRSDGSLGKALSHRDIEGTPLEAPSQRSSSPESAPVQFPHPDGALVPSVAEPSPHSAIVPPSGAIPTQISPQALSVGDAEFPSAAHSATRGYSATHFSDGSFEKALSRRESEGTLLEAPSQHPAPPTQSATVQLLGLDGAPVIGTIVPRWDVPLDSYTDKGKGKATDSRREPSPSSFEMKLVEVIFEGPSSDDGSTSAHEYYDPPPLIIQRTLSKRLFGSESLAACIDFCSPYPKGAKNFQHRRIGEATYSRKRKIALPKNLKKIYDYDELKRKFESLGPPFIKLVQVIFGERSTVDRESAPGQVVSPPPKKIQESLSQTLFGDPMYANCIEYRNQYSIIFTKFRFRLVGESEYSNTKHFIKSTSEEIKNHLLDYEETLQQVGSHWTRTSTLMMATSYDPAHEAYQPEIPPYDGPKEEHVSKLPVTLVSDQYRNDNNVKGDSAKSEYGGTYIEGPIQGGGSKANSDHQVVTEALHTTGATTII